MLVLCVSFVVGDVKRSTLFFSACAGQEASSSSYEALGSQGSLLPYQGPKGCASNVQYGGAAESI
jgi:hypothetical protein